MNELIINAPRQGISLSPHVGFQEIRNLDISSIPGIVSLNNILTLNSSTTIETQVNWIIRDPVTTTKCYAVDSAGQVYVGTYATGAWSWAKLTGEAAKGAGQGLAIWKDYLFVPRATAMDLYGPLSGTPAWRDAWAGLTMDSDTLWHPMIVSKNDNKLYGGAGKYVFSIDENTGKTFLWSDNTTWTATAQALDLPTAYRIKCIEELGNNLMLGTWQGTNVYDIRIADIFPWDRSSPSFGQPIVIDDYGVHAMKNGGNFLAVLAGTSGTIFRCDGVNAYVIGQLPIDLSGGKYLEWYPGALINYKNKIFFGVGTGGTWGAANAPSPMGIYSILQTGKGNILNFEHTISAGTDGSAASVKISALLPITRDTLFVGSRSDTTYNIDLTTATSYTTSYGGYFTAPLYIVGSHNDLRKFTEIEFQLARPLRTNEGIKIEYRDDLTASFTTLATYPFSTIGAVTSWNAAFNKSVNIPKCELLQLKISLTGTTTSPELKTVIIR